MFFKLVSRNSKRSRKENGLFFSSLIISVVAFYIILSLSNQDVMIFLKKMESDAVNKLMMLIPAFYVLTLVILFFLIYFSCKYQLERRSHEFGVYLILGMRRGNLFFMLLAEDLKNSLAALAIGIPIAVTVSELTSLITAKVVGLGIIGHTFSFSPWACMFTIAGFLVIKLAAFLILSGTICRKEIGTLLAGALEGTKKQRPAVVYMIALLAGLICLFAAYAQSILGTSWKHISNMFQTLALGFVGTMLLFYGLRMVFALILRKGGKDKALGRFHFRQIQESVIRQSGSMAVSCMLIITGLCSFGSGISFTTMYRSGEHVIDYTFVDSTYEDVRFGEKVRTALDQAGLTDAFSDLFEMRTGHPRTEDYENCLQVGVLLEELEKLPDSTDREILLNNIGNQSFPHLISLSGYNELLKCAGEEEIRLSPGEAAVYMGKDFTTESRTALLDGILETSPEVELEGDPIVLKGPVHTENIVTDRANNIMFGLILPDEEFERYTENRYEVYVNGALKEEVYAKNGLMAAIMEMNETIDPTGLYYESYIQNMGRQLFYLVAASYLTIYLAVIFLIVANTMIGVRFLMTQRKTMRRYKTLARLGADYETLLCSVKKQVNWYFGIPVVIGALNSMIASRALIPVLLSSGAEGSMKELMAVSVSMILLLCVVEWIYMWAVRRAAGRQLLTVMVPEREE